jgi:hypothetical protein
MQHTQHASHPTIELARIYRAPAVTVARLTLESYFRSGWMWGEFVLSQPVPSFVCRTS